MGDYIVKFKKPYTFEGQTYEEIDLSELDSLTTDALCKAQSMTFASGQQPVLAASSFQYCMLLASFATGKPIEFFMQLPAREGAAVQAKVFGHFFG